MIKKQASKVILFNRFIVFLGGLDQFKIKCKLNVEEQDLNDAFKLLNFTSINRVLWRIIIIKKKKND